MKAETVKKLDAIARLCVAGLESEVRCGLTTPAAVRDVQSKTRNPTRIEVIKSMIRSDLRKASALGAGGSPTARALANAMKSSEHANYLANAIDARIKRRAWGDRAFDAVYRALFGVRPRRAARRA